MHIVKFIGRVLPESCKVSCKQPEISWKMLDGKVEAKFNVEIKDSRVLVTCELENYLQEYHSHLYIRALDLVRISLDLLAFETTYSLTIVFDYFEHFNGKRVPIVLNNPNLLGICTAFNNKSSEKLDTIFKIVAKEPNLFIALNDLVVTLNSSHLAAINCTRVIDALKWLIFPVSTEREIAWSNLRKNLQIERSYLELITKNGTTHRHGVHSYISGELTQEMVKRTWIIMNRFLEYRKRGNVELPIAEFAVLK